MQSKKWVGSLVLCFLFIMSSGNDVEAALTKGEFIPVCTVNTISTESKVKLYEVKKGDTLWDISRKHQVELNTVLVMNNLNKNSVLAVGQTLEIPYDRARVHTIIKGETMWDIAQKYDVDVNQIIRANLGKNPSSLKIGDKLDIPDSISSRPVLAYNEPSRSMTRTATQFIWPLVGTITSKYGWRSSGFHHGLDIAGDRGDSIKAAAAGTVTFADFRAVYGRTIIIEHPDGYETLYAHMESFKVGKGAKVAKGQVIGTVGTTGRTTGPHVHFEVKKDSQNFDPLTYLR